MDTITTILKYGNNKNCMLLLVDSYQNSSKRKPRSNRDEEIIVYEADLARGLKAYFSVQGNTVELSSGDTVQLNALYANKLVLKDNDPLPLRRIKSTVARAIRIHTEPESVDDWEILENNAGRVELVLLDQVRVVWKGQILPVWIHPSICVFLKISDIEPAASCVILENDTEVVVAPKARGSAPPSSLNLPSPNGAGLEQRQQRSASLKMSRQYEPMNSPNRSKSEQLTNSSEYENVDILEPRPSIPSPTRSVRTSVKRASAQRPTNFGSMTATISQPFVQRQSSLMDSIRKYIFPTLLMGEKKEVTDNLSDSDKGSLKDFSMKELPSRSGVLRVQPLSLSYKLEEYFTVNKAELNKQIKNRVLFGFRGSTHVSPFKMSEDQMNLNIPLEVFQPSTIYVDAECTKNERLLHPYLPYLPNNFIARLQRLPSPQEKAMAAQMSGKKPKTSNAGISAESSQADTQENLDVTSPVESSGTGDITSISESCYVRVVVIDRKAGLTNSVWQKAAEQVLSHQPLLYGHVIIPDLLRRQLRLDTTGSVWIQTGTIDLVIPRKIHIYPLSTIPRTVSNDMVIMAFTNYIRQCANEKHPLVVFQGIFIKFVIFPELQAEVQLTFFGENDPGNVKAVTMLSEINIDHIQVVVVQDLKEDKMGVVKTMLHYCQTSDFDPKPYPVKLKQLGGVDNLIQQALLYLQASLASRPFSRQCFQVRGGLSHGIILITGSKGSGKTSLVKGLCRKMAQLPVLAHVFTIDCKTLRGKTVSNIQKVLEVIFDEAAWREPAVVVLENLDIIVPAASGPETEFSPEALYSAKNAQVLEGLIRYEIDNNSRVAVIATSISRSSLHSSLISSRGLHCIQHSLNIGSPNKDAREKILLSLLQKHSSISTETVKTLDVTSIAVKTEGFVARDLELLVNRTLHTRVSKDREAYSSKFTLTVEDFEETLSDFKPVSVRNVPLHRAGELGWLDVGGLESVKKVLVETLRWPTKYPQLFSSCPLRLRSGILLYGAPGTGKTLLAGVVAKECGLNFISVKGPELLNKYIGASEQAIRDLFTKAQSAKPCILFFDEFDSIAPKRGHDSTGVTDRVVNQLLTQLDGVEGLQGVYVLAATSRPDLIDPALLRPGRLDISLNCAMPDENERHDILVALTHKMSLAADVDLKAVAVMCEYFTGADLKALLYNAQLKVIHEQTDGDRSLNKSVLWIKGDISQCGTSKRKASLVVDDAGLLRINLAKSISENSLGEKSSLLRDLQSPRQISKSSEQSPQETSITSSTRGSKSHLVNNESSVQGEDEVDFGSKNGWGDRNDTSKGSIFQYPDNLDSGFRDEVMPDISPKDGPNFSHEITDKVNDLPLGYSSSVAPNVGLDAVPAGIPENYDLQNNSALNEANDMELRSLGEVLHFQTKTEETKVAEEGAETGLTSTEVSSTNAELMIGVGSSIFPHQDEVDGKKPVPFEAEKSLQHPKPVSTSLSSYRKKRGSERTKARGNPKSLNIKTSMKEEAEVKSPSLDRPITVFSSLARGLATLSVEDEARYLAMVKEIQHRDEILFEAANAKRRTSLQLESKVPILMEVCQRHLLEAAKSMRPSVSASERERYQQIYDNFVSSRKVDFHKNQQTTVEKRATLA